MREAGISGLVRRKRGRTTISVPGVRVADDLVERQFRPGRRRTCSGSPTSPTCRTWEGWLYLAAVQDAYSRAIVGWSMADHMRAELVVDALQMAVARRRPEPGLIHHSDQGSAIRLAGLRPGRPRRRHRALDGLQGRLLRQRRRRELLRDAQEGARPPPLLADPPRAHQEVFEYIEAFYNRVRRHSTLGMLAPAGLREQHSQRPPEPASPLRGSGLPESDHQQLEPESPTLSGEAGELHCLESSASCVWARLEATRCVLSLRTAPPTSLANQPPHGVAPSSVPFRLLPGSP